MQLMYGRLPWHGKSEMELLSNISHAQIPFHLEQSVTEQAKDFIKGCLQVDEKKRISWEDVYVHPLFSKRLEGMALQKSPNADYAITDLRRKVHS
jgi:serine/threonine-protein kinase ULK/ATG1